ncbi:MAG: transposase, partial [bacterium]
AEMYLKGVSTRKVTAIVGELCGFDITSTQVSRATQELDAELELWRSRPLGTTPFVQLDASYEKSMDPFDPVRYSSPAASQPMAIERFSVSVSP